MKVNDEVRECPAAPGSKRYCYWSPSGGLQFRRISVGNRCKKLSRKSDKDTRQYQAIRLDNDMVVLLVSDPQAVKSLSALVVPVGSLEDPEAHQGLAHYLEHMCLMGSKKYPQADSLAEYLKRHGGSHNASTAPYRTAFYPGG
ncbi:protease [Salmonella enterica subsp. enterica]|uniref:Protease n=1 Tax=Salmonella enterica I TaxID=59201 RepID=A0A3S4JI13_SALET|nr:protease [Salmonella enterica subsp. enterica]